MANEAKLATFSSKKMLLENGKKGIVIKFTERKEVEVIKATKHYNVGDVLNPHIVKAEALITQGIAKEFKPKTTKD
jgi:hypothetical protein